MKKPKALTIEGRTAFKNFLASFTVHNHTNMKKLNGFKLMDMLKPKLVEYLQIHNGIKFYFNARYEMRRMLDGQVLETDKNWWKTSNIQSLNNMSQLDDTVLKPGGALHVTCSPPPRSSHLFTVP